MAIRRCPYCKAIIDEGSEYCSNCGTQLLFPEDEYIEEEIPGEEIIDEDIKEEPEPTEEVESSESGTSSGKRKRKKKENAEEEITEEEIAGDIEERAEQKEEEIPEEQEKEEFGSVEEEDQKFRTEDLEKIVDAEEKEKAEIEKFLRSLKEDRDEWQGEIPPTDEFPPWAEKIKEEEKKDDEELLVEEEEPVEVIQDDIQEEEVPEGNIREEEPSEEEVSMPDTGMGLPEGLEQESLPFEAKPAEVYEEEAKKPPSRISMWLKSRAFDVLFIAAIWIVTLHIASRMMSTNLFRLISVSALSVFALYLVLLAVYLFLFFFFLGQTLGDHLFSQEE